MGTVPRTGKFGDRLSSHDHRVGLARVVIRYGASTNLGIFVVTVLSGPDIGRVAPAGITAVGTITLAVIGVVGAAMRGLPRQRRA